MSRSRSACAAACGLLAAAAPAVAVAQDGSGPPARADVVDLQLPIIDISTPVSSLDGSVSRTESAQETRITLSADILFAFDKASLSGKSRSRLEDVREQLRAAKPGSVRIEGHTDDKGSDAYNVRLSERRARTVARALRSALSGADVAVAGRGEADPVAANTVDGKDSPKGRARNRRVEIRLPKEGS